MYAESSMVGVADEAIEGWTFFEDTGLYYRYFPTANTSWIDAREFCLKQGKQGDLASADTSAINTFVSSLAPGDAWIGGYQEKGTEDPTLLWKWSDGSDWDFENWADGEPNDCYNEYADGKEDYLVTNFHHESGTHGQWNDMSINGNMDPTHAVVGFICQTKF